MPSWHIWRSLSLPLLQIKRLQRHLSFVHLALIPEVPLRMPSHPNLKEVEQLLDLIDFCIEDSKSEVPCPDSSAQTWAGSHIIRDIFFLPVKDYYCMSSYFLNPLDFLFDIHLPKKLTTPFFIVIHISFNSINYHLIYICNLHNPLDHRIFLDSL